jgi:hypothetical protein
MMVGCDEASECKSLVVKVILLQMGSASGGSSSDLTAIKAYRVVGFLIDRAKVASGAAQNFDDFKVKVYEANQNPDLQTIMVDIAYSDYSDYSESLAP